MAIIKNIDLDDNVSTTGVSELNENFNSLNNQKLEKIENYDFVNDLEDTDILLMYRPTDWTTYKITVSDFKSAVPWPGENDYPLWEITSWFGVCPKYISWEEIVFIAWDLRLKKKSAKSFSDWFPIATDNWNYPLWGLAVCPVRDELVYKNITSPNDWIIFKKTKDWLDNWEAITTNVCNEICYSPNWQFIVYSNSDDSNKLYKKDITITWTWNWTAITSVAGRFPKYSPDWLSIIYRKEADWKLYKKNSDDTGDWVLIISENVAFSSDFSSDWTYIIYDTWTWIWKKLADDENDWIEIYSEVGTNLEYSPDNTVITCSKWNKIFNYADVPFILPIDYPIGVATSHEVLASVPTDENSWEFENKLIYMEKTSKKLYIKNLDEIWDGTEIVLTTTPAPYSIVRNTFATYWYFLFYIDNTDGCIYRKDLRTAWNWEKITNDYSYMGSFKIIKESWEIYFLAYSGSYKVYKTSVIQEVGQEELFSEGEFNYFKVLNWYLYYFLDNDWIYRKDITSTTPSLPGEKITDINILSDIHFNSSWTEMFYKPNWVNEIRKRLVATSWIDNWISITPNSYVLRLLNVENDDVIFSTTWTSGTYLYPVFKKKSDDFKRWTFLSPKGGLGITNNFSIDKKIIITETSETASSEDAQYNIENKTFNPNELEYFIWNSFTASSAITFARFVDEWKKIMYVQGGLLKIKSSEDLLEWVSACSNSVWNWDNRMNAFFADDDFTFYTNDSDGWTIYKKETLNNSDDWVIFSSTPWKDMKKWKLWWEDIILFQNGSDLCYKKYDWTGSVVILDSDCFTYDVYEDTVIFSDWSTATMYKIKTDWTWKTAISWQSVWKIIISPNGEYIAYTSFWSSLFLYVKRLDDLLDWDLIETLNISSCEFYPLFSKDSKSLFFTEKEFTYYTEKIHDIQNNLSREIAEKSKFKRSAPLCLSPDWIFQAQRDMETGKVMRWAYVWSFNEY